MIVWIYILAITFSLFFIYKLIEFGFNMYERFHNWKLKSGLFIHIDPTSKGINFIYHSDINNKEYFSLLKDAVIKYCKQKHISYNHYIKEVGYLSYYRTTIDEKSSVISIVDYISKRVGNQYNRVEDLENILNIFIDNFFIQYKRELRKNIQSQVLDEIQEKEK